MKDGSLKLRFEAGKVVEIFTNPGLDTVFEGLYRSAFRAFRRQPQRLRNGIAVIVFGSFWIEAYCNYCLRSLLQFKKETAKWKSLEKKATHTKFEVILRSANRTQQLQFRVFKRRLKDVFDLRDRLAHFKDEDFKIGGPLPEGVDVVNFSASCPEPELIHELKGQSVKVLGATIAGAGEWLRKVYVHFSQQHGVKSTRHRARSFRQPNQSLKPTAPRGAAA